MTHESTVHVFNWIELSKLDQQGGFIPEGLSVDYVEGKVRVTLKHPAETPG